MRLPRNISPAAARRRSLLVDIVLGILLGILAIALAAGIGVIGFLALLGVVGIAASWIVEGWLRWRGRGVERRNGRARGPRSSRS